MAKLIELKDLQVGAHVELSYTNGYTREAFIVSQKVKSTNDSKITGVALISEDIVLVGPFDGKMEKSSDENKLKTFQIELEQARDDL